MRELIESFTFENLIVFIIGAISLLIFYSIACFITIFFIPCL